MRLSDRQRQILMAIVEEYIQTGQPVGSKRLTELLTIKVSPATVRSDMAYLYDFGYLEQPHTSAGRIPSHLGIREYIDDLMSFKPLAKQEEDAIKSLFNVRDPDPDQLLKDASEALSQYTGYTSITSSVMSPNVKVRRIEFLGASENAVVIVLVATNGTIRSKVVRVDFRVTTELMDFFYKFANSRFVGRGIESITTMYIGSVSMTLGEYSRIFTTLLIGIYDLCKEVSDGKYYIAGTTKVLNYAKSDTVSSRDLMRTLEDTEILQRLFGLDDMDMQILVGKENTQIELTGSATIMSHYYVGEDPAGSVGIIGPIRMDYAKIIPHLEYFSNILGELMTKTLNPENTVEDEE